MFKWFVSALWLVSIFMFASHTNASVWFVCPDSAAGMTHSSWYVQPRSAFSTIQGALDACSTGDTVVVAPGSYFEQIVWPNTMGIDLISAFGPELTIINADGHGRVITMAEDLSQNTIIDGFTLINGNAKHNSPDSCGGAVYCLNSSPTIQNNIIRDNSAYYRGGGIYCERSSPLILGNIIKDNGTTLGNGGGISCFNGSAAMIQENQFINNSATSGGAIECMENSDADIQNCTLNANRASSGGGVLTGWEGQFGGPSSCITMHYTNLFGNRPDGLHDGNWYCHANAKECWWGHSAGPDSGDGALSAQYDPWLTQEIRFDVSIVSIESPSTAVNSGAIYQPKIVVKNDCNYPYPISFFTAKCTIGGYQDYVRVSRSVLKDSIVEVVFADWTAPPMGSDSVQMTVTIFYAVDNDLANNTISRQLKAEPSAADDRDVSSVPSSPELLQNFPNPFNPTTQIGYVVDRACIVELTIHNIIGQKLATLVSEFQPKGRKQVIWNGRDDEGNVVASGVYFYRLKAGERSYTRKMIILK